MSQKKTNRSRAKAKGKAVVHQCPTCGYLMTDIEFESILLDACPECKLRTNYPFGAALYNFTPHRSLKTCKPVKPRIRNPFGIPTGGART